MYNLIASPKVMGISSITPVTSLSELIIIISQDRNGQIKSRNEIIGGMMSERLRCGDSPRVEKAMRRDGNC